MEWSYIQIQHDIMEYSIIPWYHEMSFFLRNLHLGYSVRLWIDVFCHHYKVLEPFVVFLTLKVFFFFHKSPLIISLDHCQTGMIIHRYKWFSSKIYLWIKIGFSIFWHFFSLLIVLLTQSLGPTQLLITDGPFKARSHWQH